MKNKFLNLTLLFLLISTLLRFKSHAQSGEVSFPVNATVTLENGSMVDVVITGIVTDPITQLEHFSISYPGGDLKSVTSDSLKIGDETLPFIETIVDMKIHPNAGASEKQGDRNFDPTKRPYDANIPAGKGSIIGGAVASGLEAGVTAGLVGMAGISAKKAIRDLMIKYHELVKAGKDFTEARNQIAYKGAHSANDLLRANDFQRNQVDIFTAIDGPIAMTTSDPVFDKNLQISWEKFESFQPKTVAQAKLRGLGKRFIRLAFSQFMSGDIDEASMTLRTVDIVADTLIVAFPHTSAGNNFYRMAFAKDFMDGRSLSYSERSKAAVSLIADIAAIRTGNYKIRIPVVLPKIVEALEKLGFIEPGSVESAGTAMDIVKEQIRKNKPE